MKGSSGTANRSLSVVIPVSVRYDNPRALYEAYREGLAPLNRKVEFIYVIDGNSPAFYEAVLELQSEGEPIRIVKLGRRFGESAALSAGFRHAAGEVILTLPAYYQVQASDLPQLVQGLDSADLVVGRRWPRQDSGFNRLQTGLFSGLVRLFTNVKFSDLACDARAMRRRVCDEVLLYGDQHRFLPLLAAHRGFRVREVDMAQSDSAGFYRFNAPGLYLRRVLDLLTVFFLTKFTKRPMRFFGLVGSATASIGGLYMLVLVAQRLVLGLPLADRPALLLSALMLVLGVQIFAMGLIGELIIFTHGRQTQEFAIEEVVESGAEEGSGPGSGDNSDANATAAEGVGSMGGGTAVAGGKSGAGDLQNGLSRTRSMG